MKVLIYGAKGWIGSMFVNIMEEKQIEYVVGLSRTDNKETLATEIETVNPSHVISFIGRTHGTIGTKKISTIDYLEEPGKLVENIRDNLFSPFLLAELCSQTGIHYTYLGTGCIFKYEDHFEKEENGFTEKSKPNFFGSSYSIVKGFTDQMMAMYPVLNLRIRMPIVDAHHERNFITKIVNYEKICSIANSMTVLPELLPLVLIMMEQKTIGTLNLTNPGLISHNEILELYKEFVDPSFTWKNFTQEEQRAILTSDRSNNYLDTSRLQTLFPNVKPIKVAIRECLLRYQI